MPEIVNTLALMDGAPSFDDDNKPTMVSVSNVSMVFNIANQQLNSFKEYAIALMRRELMFKEFRALSDISFEVKKGDVFGILGTNGSGKSTLLKIVAGVLEPSGGSVAIHGNIAPLIELGAGFDYELTARENIYLNGALLGYSKAFIDEAFDEIVEFAEVRPFLDMPIKNYSSGMVARIAFAIATVIVPDILIVDEVLSVGDFKFQQKCENRIKSLINDHGTTVLIVSHSNDQIERLCNKAVWIEKGHMRLIGDAKEVCRTYRALGGREGSVESEALVLDLLKLKDEVPSGFAETISSNDRYGTAAKLLNECDFSSSADTVVVSSGANATAHALATNMANNFGCPSLITAASWLPEQTQLLIRRFEPKCIVMVSLNEEIEGNVIDEMASSCPNAEINILAASDTLGLSLEVANYIAAHAKRAGDSIWSPVTFLATDDGLIDYAAVASYTKMHATLLLCVGGASESAIADAVPDYSKHVLILGGSSLNEGLVRELDSRGHRVTPLYRSAGETVNVTAVDWLSAERKKSGEETTVAVLATSRGATDAISAVQYASQVGGAILTVNHNDFDSIAQAIGYLRDRSPSFQHLVFVGGGSSFDEGDKDVLAKAAMRVSGVDMELATCSIELDSNA